MFEEVIKLSGKRLGPTSIILAGVHGNEKCGVEALANLLPGLNIEAGDLLIAYGNPLALKNDQRFMDANLNRMFKGDGDLSDSDRASYEYGRAQFLKQYLVQASASLDLHASLNPNSRPFVICESNAREIVSYLPIDLVVSGFDQLEPGGTDYYMNRLGKIGICLECGYVNDPNSVNIAKASILAFLSVRGHLGNSPSSQKQSCLKMSKIYLTKADSFKLNRPFADFEEITAGQIIGLDGSEEVRADNDGFILFANNRDKIGAEAFLSGEKNSPA